MTFRLSLWDSFVKKILRFSVPFYLYVQRSTTSLIYKVTDSKEKYSWDMVDTTEIVTHCWTRCFPVKYEDRWLSTVVLEIEKKGHKIFGIRLP